ncbi:Uncharacterised protein [Streptococcus pneumoniae]|nr:Uncharacterised protein [Streptococcus pneumoniae]
MAGSSTTNRFRRVTVQPGICGDCAPAAMPWATWMRAGPATMPQPAAALCRPLDQGGGTPSAAPVSICRGPIRAMAPVFEAVMKPANAPRNGIATR